MRLLNAPVPVLMAILAPQIEPPDMSTPAWVAAIIGVAYVLLSYLNWIGRLPGATGERRTRSFTDADRAMLTETHDQLEAVHEVVTREDKDKPGWRMVWAPAGEIRELTEAMGHLTRTVQTWIERDREGR